MSDKIDGGGIRGLWSLMALEKLMEYIGDKEEKLETDAIHSFYPSEMPFNVSQITPTAHERRQNERSGTLREQICGTPRPRRYLPCHYFDLICGSSTGA